MVPVLAPQKAFEEAFLNFFSIVIECGGRAFRDLVVNRDLAQDEDGS